MSVMRGHATIKGVSGGTCTVKVSGYVMAFVDSLPIQVTSDLTEHHGAHGEGICAMEWSNHRIILEATFRPAAASKATMVTNTVLLLPGDVVTLDDFLVVKVHNPPAGMDAARAADLLNGDWILTGPNSTLTLNTANPAEVQLTLGFYFDRHASLITPIA